MMKVIPNFSEINNLVLRGATFFCNDSGGKDSRAMYLLLRNIVPKEQLIVIHADLGRVEWPGTEAYIKKNIDVEYMDCRNPNKDFFGMVLHRGKWPSASCRQCTSDLKRGPITTAIRQWANRTGKRLIVNCMGLRAAESDNREFGLMKLAEKKRARKRAKKGLKTLPVTFRLNEANSVAGREWYDWLPIHNLTTEEVFGFISLHGQKPFWTYAWGMERKSCSFCILGCKEDLTISAQLRPALYEEYVLTEIALDHTLQMSQKFLPEITGIDI